MIMDGIFLLYVLVVLAGMMLSGMVDGDKEDESQMANLGKEAGVWTRKNSSAHGDCEVNPCARTSCQFGLRSGLGAFATSPPPFVLLLLSFVIDIYIVSY